MNRARFRRVCIIVAVFLVILGVWMFLRFWRAKRDGVVASLRLPDGSEYMVVQSRNTNESPYTLDYLRFSGPYRRLRWTAEPYYVGFYMRPPGGAWGWCYVDHRANYWRDARITYDPSADVIAITEGGRWRAALDRKRHAFSIGDGKPIREVAAPQGLWAPAFPFPKSGSKTKESPAPALSPPN